MTKKQFMQLLKDRNAADKVTTRLKEINYILEGQSTAPRSKVYTLMTEVHRVRDIFVPEVKADEWLKGLKAIERGQRAARR